MWAFRVKHFATEPSGFADVDSDRLADLAVAWRSLALALGASLGDLDTCDVRLCKAHGGADPTLRERCSRWLHRFAEIGFSTAAALIVMGVLSLERRDDQ